MERLKSCPFCGGDAKYFAFSDGGVCVKCMNCFCQTEARCDFSITECTKSNAIETVTQKWNRRANDDTRTMEKGE